MNAAPSPTGSPVTREAALRIALAARTLPGVEISAFVRALGDKLGLPVTDDKLARMTVEDLKVLLQGDEIVDPGMDATELKKAVRYLWGEGIEDDAPKPEADVPAADGALKVAVASNSGELLDGHFGSCTRFLIYQISEAGTWLLDVRSAAAADQAEDRNAARAQLVGDCHLVYVQSIGGPAAAKVVRTGVHPVKFPKGGPAREVLEQLKGTLRRPPPWLAKVLGKEASTIAHFVSDEEEADA